MKRLKMMVTAAFCGMAVMAITGCAGSTLKPEQINGVYSNGKQTYVAKFDSEMEINTKEKMYAYKIYADTNDKYKDNVIYSKGKFLISPKDGTMYEAEAFTGNLKKFGQIKDNKMTVTVEDEVISLHVGEYPKTKDPIPDDKVLSYNGFSAAADKLKDYKPEPYHSKFEELANARGWK